MKTDKIFRKTYIENILQPFENKNLIIQNNQSCVELLPKIETTVNSHFKISIKNDGIKLYLNDHYFLNNSLNYHIKKSLLDLGIYPHQLDTISKQKDTFEKAMLSVHKYLELQIAFIYFSSIKSIQVHEEGFYINGIKFTIYK